MEEKKMTGLSSVDMPWLKQYKNFDSSRDEQYITNSTVWDVAEKMLQKYSHINFIEYFGRNISREEFAGTSCRGNPSARSRPFPWPSRARPVCRPDECCRHAS